MLIYEDSIRKRIRALRVSGYTYAEIQKKINMHIPKGSMSYICKDIELSDEARKRISGLSRRSTDKARKLAVIANRKYRLNMLAELRSKNSEFSYLSDKEAKIALAYLYLGEGAKWRSHSGLQLGSSDARIIRSYIYLLWRCFRIGPDQLRVSVGHRYDQDLLVLQSYWSDITDIPLSHFYKSIPDPRTKDKPTMRSDYMGVCKVSVAGARYQLELDIIIDIIDEAVKGL